MKQPRFAVVTIAALVMGLTACSGSYKNQIQGSYGSSFKRGGEAMRAKDYESAAEHYAYAAESGHPRALIAYGRLFAKGNGVEQDPARAVTLLQDAYEKTSDFRPKAALELAQIYMKGGDGPSGAVERNEVLARALFEQALDGGERKAAVNLGRIYDKGLGVDRDPERAIAYYQRAAVGNAGSAQRLATLMVNAGASKADVAAMAKRAISELEDSALAGDQQAWMKLAEIYTQNRIIDPDPARALSYLRKVPDDGDPAMNLRLARLYGQAGDRQERKERLRLAADAGDAKAQTALAKLFLKGGTVDTNGAVGRYYAERAIGQDSKEAMVHLGLALVRGDVLRRDPPAGETLLRRASEAGHADASVALGSAILGGDLRGREPGEGRELLEAAANKGSADAMSALGFAYQLGRGLPTNQELALEWLQKAADAGQRDAKAFLKRRQTSRGA